MNGARPVVIVRYGEIALKGGNRGWFEKLLKRRVAEALKEVGHGVVERPHGRIVVRDVSDARRGAERAARVFGVTSASPAVAVAADEDAIQTAARAAMDEALARNPAARTFRVDARRADKSFPLTSVELNHAVGGRLAAAHPGLKVDLGAPHVTVGIEVRAEEALVFAESLPGPGGLPLGSIGGAVALLSGGIDSPVAAWLAMKRGLRVGLLHFHAAPFVGDASREKALDLARALSAYAPVLDLYVAPLADVQVEIRRRAPEEYWTILFRRAMNRVAVRLAEATGALALVTGESLGQVASQTLENLRCIEDAADRLVLRPLITFDKEETIRIARAIGTFDVSIRPHLDCCTLFQPRHPKIRGVVDECRGIEEGTDLAALEERAFAALEHVRVRNGAAAEPRPFVPARLRDALHG
jgi:thiamine biosynthesis protein ThiI